MRIYIESTMPSYLVARPARDLLQAARQQMTKDWWDLKSGQHELFTSQIVLDEIAEGERAMANRRLKIMSGVPVLELTAGAADLTRRILDSGLVPAKADADAAHIALATVHQMDILLTWNSGTSPMLPSKPGSVGWSRQMALNCHPFARWTN